ncbi:MAG: VWA domain-containing protein [Vicinamibacterales bacterium]
MPTRHERGSVRRDARAWGPLVVALGLAALASVAGLAARQTRTPPREQQPVFRGGANFVHVDVYPRADGRPIEDLTQADFEILEDGKPQAIETFELVRAPLMTPEAARRDPATVLDSRVQAADPTNRVFVFYLDGSHLDMEAARRARGPLREFAGQLIGPSDLLAVMTPGLPLADLTFGRRLEVVDDALEDYWRSVNAAPTRNRYQPDPGSPYQDFLYTCYIGRTDQIEVNQDIVASLLERARSERALEDLRTLVSGLGAMREARSNVLVISSGWRMPGASTRLHRYLWNEIPQPGVTPLGRLTVGATQPGQPTHAACDQEMQRLTSLDFRGPQTEVIEAAKRANVGMYFVDPGGLAIYDAGPADEGLSTAEVMGRQQALRELADQTGGRTVALTMDIRAPLREIARDLSSYYLLGYYSTNGTFDGRFRRIEVKVRRPDVQVRARQGYYAPSEAELRRLEMDEARRGAGRPAAELEAAFEVLASRARGLPLFGRGVALPGRLVLAAEVPADQARQYVPEGGTLTWQIREGDQGDTREVETRVVPGTRGASAEVPIPPGETGPWTVRVDLAGAEKTRTEFAVSPVSTLLLGDPIIYRRARTARGAPEAMADLFVRRTDRIRVEWPLARAVETQEAHLLDRQSAALPVDLRLSERSDAAGRFLVLDLPLAALAPGDYAVQVDVAAGGDRMTHAVAFRVVR